MKNDHWTRRSLMTGIGASVPALALTAGKAGAQAPPSGFQPARHELDAWMDEVPGQHRIFIDSANWEGGLAAVAYASNLYGANEGAYSIPPEDLAMIICFRHWSTIFAFNDDIWARYGEPLSAMFDLKDPKTGAAPTHNLANASDNGLELPNFGRTIAQQVERGAQFAVCQAATSFFSRQIAQATGGEAGDVYEELMANAIPNAHFMSAGVVALTRAQEYGYSVLYAG